MNFKGRLYALIALMIIFLFNMKALYAQEKWYSKEYNKNDQVKYFDRVYRCDGAPTAIVLNGVAVRTNNCAKSPGYGSSSGWTHLRAHRSDLRTSTTEEYQAAKALIANQTHQVRTQANSNQQQIYVNSNQIAQNNNKISQNTNKISFIESTVNQVKGIASYAYGKVQQYAHNFQYFFVNLRRLQDQDRRAFHYIAADQQRITALEIKANEVATIQASHTKGFADAHWDRTVLKWEDEQLKNRVDALESALENSSASITSNSSLALINNLQEKVNRLQEEVNVIEKPLYTQSQILTLDREFQEVIRSNEETYLLKFNSFGTSDPESRELEMSFFARVEGLETFKVRFAVRSSVTGELLGKTHSYPLNGTQTQKINLKMLQSKEQIQNGEWDELYLEAEIDAYNYQVATLQLSNVSLLVKEMAQEIKVIETGSSTLANSYQF